MPMFCGLCVFQQFLINRCNVFTRRGKFVVRTFTIIDTDYFNLSQSRNGNRFELCATGPAARESAAMKIDQYSVFILRRDSGFRRVDIHVHTANFLVFLLNGKQFVVTCDVSLHESRHPGILFQNFRVLHVFQMLCNVGLCFGAEKEETGAVWAGTSTVPSV